MYLAGVREDVNEIDIWEYQSRKFLATLRPPCSQGLNTFDDVSYSFSNSGCLLAVAAVKCGNVVYDVTDLTECKELFILEKPKPLRYPALARFSKDDEHIIVGYDHMVVLYDASTGAILRQAEGHTDVVVFVQHVGHKILTVSEDGVLIEWSLCLQEQRRLDIKNETSLVCVSRAEDLIALSGEGSGTTIVSLQTFQQLANFGKESFYMSLEFDSTGCRLLGNWHNDRATFNVIDVLSGSLVLHRESGHGICYSLDGSLIYGGRQKGCIICWGAETGADITSDGFPAGSSKGRGHQKIFIVGREMFVLL
jgi:WD40 repeat protein